MKPDSELKLDANQLQLQKTGTPVLLALVRKRARLPGGVVSGLVQHNK